MNKPYRLCQAIVEHSDYCFHNSEDWIVHLIIIQNQDCSLNNSSLLKS